MSVVQTVDVSDFVSVTVDVTPLSIPFENFGIPIFIGDSTVIDVNERFRSYSTLDQVGADFGDTAPEYLAAEIYFSQSPQPARLFVGRWASTATPGMLEGAILTAQEQLLANFTSITNGAFNVSIDGVPHNISGVSFASALNINGVAALIQAALPSGVLCVWDAGQERFEITSSTTGTSSSVSALSAPAAIGSAAFSGQPAANDTLTLGGTAVTFVSASPAGNQVLIGASEAATLQALLSFLNASADVNLSKLNYVVTGTTLYYVDKTPGSAGDTFTTAKSSAAITLSGATLTGGSGTDISTLLGGTLAAGADVVVGIAAESTLAAVQAAANASSQWYGAMLASTVQPANSDYEAIAAYILASSRTRIFGITTQSTEVLDPVQTQDIASILQTFNNKRVFVMYSSTNAYAAATMFGRAFTVNFNGNLTTITLAYKQAPGLQGENLTETQFASLVGKGCNVNINVDNGATMIWQGKMSNGFSFDEVHGTDWFQNRVQTDVFNELYTTSTKVPQTDAGDNLLAGVMAGSCKAAINNGFAAPGQWNAAGFGSLQQGDTLTAGYYIYYPPIATQAQNLREERESVVFQIALKLAGAVELPFVVININR